MTNKRGLRIMRNTQFLPLGASRGERDTPSPRRENNVTPHPPSCESTSELAVLCGRSGGRPVAAAWLAWDAKECRGGPSIVSLCVSWAENGDKKDRSDRTVPGGSRTGPKHRERSKASAQASRQERPNGHEDTEQPGPSKSGSPFVSNP